jgi:predicted transcriptional regulator
MQRLDAPRVLPEVHDKEGRRSRFDMLCDVLRTLSEGPTGPTRVMFRTNLSWKMALGSLRELADLRLVAISVQEGRSTYGLTKDGTEVVRHYVHLKEALGFRESAFAFAFG